MTDRPGAATTLLDRVRTRKFVQACAIFAVAFVVLFVADGSRQPTSGAGWRILGYQRAVGNPETVVALTDAAGLDAAWDKLRLAGAPTVDFGTQAVFWFVGTGSIGCPSHFAGLEIDAGRRLVASVFTRALTAGCDDKIVPDSFLVAIDRSRLPAAPYAVAVADPIPAGAAGARIDVTP